MEITAICRSMTHEEIVENLRLAFQERVAKGEFTLTEPEAEEILTKAPVSSLLSAFTNLGKFLQEEKAERLMFYSETEICEELLPKFIRKVDKKNANPARAVVQ